MRHSRSIKLTDDSGVEAAAGGGGAHRGGAAAEHQAQDRHDRQHGQDAKHDLPAVEVWTDGACKGNPGPGGWGAWLKSGGHEKELFGGDPATTNNRMELTAVIEALASLKRRCRVVLHTDSQYVHLGITQWLPSWQRRNWRTADNKPVKNVDLWQKLAQLQQAHEVHWRWVKGHAGIEGNERADQLANRGIEQVRRR